MDPTDIKTDPSMMTVNGFLQWVSALLIGLLVWIIKRLVDNGEANLKEMQQQARLDRELMRQENALVRADHRQDMKELLDDSEINRKTIQDGFKELAEAIRESRRI